MTTLQLKDVKSTGVEFGQKHQKNIKHEYENAPRLIGTPHLPRLHLALGTILSISTIAFSAVRLASVLYVLRSADPTLNGVYSSVWAQAELDFSIMACTFLLLGAFLKPFPKEMGPSRLNSYPLNSLSSTSKRRSRPGLGMPSAGDFNFFRPGGEGENQTTATGRSRDSRRESLETSESQQGIIVKKVQWSVARDGATPDPGVGMSGS
ncbi:hypothetical protein DL98DRAFT_588385 [Cadophora sp. DSE1049]|nr:hypothetical protein DL98DRAFT_588385 [Cadophora sp. DSE1049]